MWRAWGLLRAAAQSLGARLWAEGDRGAEREAVKQLPENYRAAIHLFYYEGYPTKQIARLLGKKEATVRSDLRRGRERLKAVLKEAYDFEGTV